MIVWVTSGSASLAGSGSRTRPVPSGGAACACSNAAIRNSERSSSFFVRSADQSIRFLNSSRSSPAGRVGSGTAHLLVCVGGRGGLVELRREDSNLRPARGSRRRTPSPQERLLLAV